MSTRKPGWLSRPQSDFRSTASELTALRSSVDPRPWEHPFLTQGNIAAFRDYSDQVWTIALKHATAHPRRLRCAFSVNMAQNMYGWARLARKYGADTGLFLHPLDNTAISLPEWEEFDGEYADVLDGPGFQKAHGGLSLEVPVWREMLGTPVLLDLVQRFESGDRKPLVRAIASADAPRHEVLLRYDGFYPYWKWACALASFDVIYTASAPFAAYASGRPYCAFSVGGDLQFDCGRGDSFGQAMTVAFSAARFLLVTNPHTLGHCRRLGFTNAVYLPYPVDSERYCPGPGCARAEWQARYGGDTFVLSTARLDYSVKGQDPELFEMLCGFAAERPGVRFVFLAWGNHAAEFTRLVEASPVRNRFILLPPVGKKRLFDYYRSCDIVLDQLVYGYFGATALEAAAIGKPVVIKLRREQYGALYRGDVAPMLDADGPAAVRTVLAGLLDNLALREACGRELRAWLVRNHGEQRTAPLMLALLQLAADRVALPEELQNPLHAPESDEEAAYHEARMVTA